MTLERANAELGARVLPRTRITRRLAPGWRARVPERRHRQRGADDHGRADGCDDGASAHRVRQCRQPAARARRGPAARDCRASRARREPGAHHPAAACRVGSALARRRRSSRCRSPGTASTGCTMPCRRPSRSVRTMCDWSLDVRTFAYAVVDRPGHGLAFGLAPAFDASGPAALNPLRDGAGAAGSRVQRRVHAALIVAQLALARRARWPGASLFVRTYVGLRRVELGYDMSHLMTMRVYFAGTAYDAAEPRAAAVDANRARDWTTLPGAHAATVTDLVPLDDQGGSDAPAEIEGRVFEEGKRARRSTTPAWRADGRRRSTCGSSSGRTFYDHELQSRRAGCARQREAGARRSGPAQNPLGRRFRLAEDASNPWLSVIGVVPDIRTVKLDESRADAAHRVPAAPIHLHAQLRHRRSQPAQPESVVAGRARRSASGRSVARAVRCLSDGAGALAELLDVRDVGHDVRRLRRASRCSLRPLACTASSSTPSRSGRGRSGFASRSARAARRWSDRCSGRSALLSAIGLAIGLAAALLRDAGRRQPAPRCDAERSMPVLRPCRSCWPRLRWSRHGCPRGGRQRSIRRSLCGSRRQGRRPQAEGHSVSFGQVSGVGLELDVAVRPC